MYVYTYLHTHIHKRGLGTRRGVPCPVPYPRSTIVAIFYPFSQFCEINIYLPSVKSA